MKRVILQSAILIVLTLIIIVSPHGMHAAAAIPAQAQGQQAPPPPAQQQGQQGPQGNYQISVNAQLVNVDAVVTDGDGNFLPGLKKENFRILEDGKPQIITNFTPAGEAPITIVLLIEFRAHLYSGNYYAQMSSYWGSAFLNQLKKNDWIALEDFDLKTRVDVDFTHDPMEVLQELRRMVVPLYSESCLYDAIGETIDRLAEVKGKKTILVVASGYDTFSKLTYDNTMKLLRQSDVGIYTIGTSQVMVDNSGAIGGIRSQVAQQQMKVFADLTGGQAWTPEFDGQIPEIMHTIAASLRNQYSLGYAPTSQDGKYHKIKVELVNADGGPMVVTNQKGKKVKFVVYARQGYTAAKAAVGD
jgi:VWFA-related protein|nr:VWA domain-containing protein [Candidatus Acidoferrales bacterium]